ncbi:MAG: hypothetical protein C4308_13105 [Chitinophagaceae bacterium]
MSVTNYSGSVIIEAKGGNGGDENDAGTTQRCYGAGGGGSGGVIYFTGALPAVTTSVAGGAAGIQYGSMVCEAPILPSSGSAGIITTSYSIRQATDSASYCISLSPLPVRLLYFFASNDNDMVKLQWKISQPELVNEFLVERKNEKGSWSVIGSITALQNQVNYFFNDRNPFIGLSLYRIKIAEKNGFFYYSPEKAIRIKTTAVFQVFPVPAKNKLIIEGNSGSMMAIEIFDASGKILLKNMMQSQGNKTELTLPLLPNGVYILKINNQFRKIIIYN